jgi:CheY-like chemotaxis protein
LAESGMTAFEIETVESCCSLRIVPADLFRPFTLIEIRQECAMSSRSRSGFDTELSCAALKLMTTRPPSSLRFLWPEVRRRTSFCSSRGWSLGHSTMRRSQTVNVMSKPQSVLIVDDEPNILLSLQFLMKKSGYEVRTSKNGEEALVEIARAAPDLVLLDVMMPKVDGFSVCQTIRANPEWKDVRIIMLTARGRDVEREKGLALGADDYITKPFSTSDAIARVQAVLGSPQGDALP